MATRALSKWAVAAGTRGATHNGLDGGLWRVPDGEREAFQQALEAIPGRWCLAEVVPTDRPVPIYFDVDLNLAAQEVDLQPMVDAFTRAVSDVLASCTDAYEEGYRSLMMVLEKPAPTKKDTCWKHGFKVMLPYDLCTQKECGALAEALRRRQGDWLYQGARPRRLQEWQVVHVRQPQARAGGRRLCGVARAGWPQSRGGGARGLYTGPTGASAVHLSAGRGRTASGQRGRAGSSRS
jgi:hypothetical protein